MAPFTLGLSPATENCDSLKIWSLILGVALATASTASIVPYRSTALVNVLYMNQVEGCPACNSRTKPNRRKTIPSPIESKLTKIIGFKHVQTQHWNSWYRIRKREKMWLSICHRAQRSRSTARIWGQTAKIVHHQSKISKNRNSRGGQHSCDILWHIDFDMLWFGSLFPAETWKNHIDPRPPSWWFRHHLGGCQVQTLIIRSWILVPNQLHLGVYRPDLPVNWNWKPTSYVGWNYQVKWDIFTHWKWHPEIPEIPELETLGDVSARSNEVLVLGDDLLQADPGAQFANSNSTQQIGSFVVLNYSSLGWVNSYMIPWISMDHMWIICWGIKHPAAGSSLPVVHGDQPFPQSWRHSTCACLESQLTSCFPMDTEGRELWDCPGNSWATTT